ncbi:MAG TPA: SdpI family protein [Anaerolineae bacterium]|nr:SdpI family protein [Anaerolineae bacterium]
MLLLQLLYILAGLAMSAIALPLIQRRIKPNPFYGFRTPKAFQSETIWYEINAYSGKRLFIAGLIIALVALLVPLLPGINLEIYVTVITFIVILSLALAFISSFRYLNQIAQ